MIASVVTEAQQAVNISRIGILRPASPPDPFVEAFRQGLHELGYVEGQNITIEYRWADGHPERLSSLATELVGLKVDVIVVGGGGPLEAASRATRSIPIVMPVSGNPVREGLVAGVARPGGNITGLAALDEELPGKWIELLKEALPRVSRVAASGILRCR